MNAPSKKTVTVKAPTTPKVQKPFGLVLACKVAAQALHDSVAPASIVLGNLLQLQKDTLFPKELDTHYFIIQKKPSTDMEKRLITVLLDELRKHPFDVSDLLESKIKEGWVVKKAPVREAFSAPAKKVVKKHKPISKKIVTDVKPPVVTVKKSKFSI